MVKPAKRSRRTRKKQRGGSNAGSNAEGISFPRTLSVSFDKIPVRNNQLLTIEKTAREPFVQWTKGPEDPPFKTLVCFDPDSKAKSWLHWLVVNCEGTSAQNCEEVVPWSGPSPAQGVHRYYFCLFSHEYKLNVVTPEQLGLFDINEFVTKNGLVADRVMMMRVPSSA